MDPSNWNGTTKLYRLKEKWGKGTTGQKVIFTKMLLRQFLKGEIGERAHRFKRLFSSHERLLLAR
jgi:hypothetical protein